MEALGWVRDGSVEELKEWLVSANVKSTIEEEDNVAAQRRSIVFGQGMYMLDMSLLLWVVDTPDLDVTTRIKLSDVLLSFYPTLVNHPGPEKATPLHYASGNGNAKLVYYLLEKGAKIVPDDRNETALHWASLNGWSDVVRLLLQSGANPNDLSVDGKSCIQLAIINKHVEVVAILLSDQKLNSACRKEAATLASQLGHQEVIQLFDPEKREIIMMSQAQQKTVEDLKESINLYEQRREMDQRAIIIAQEKLETERESHKQSLEILAQLKEELRARSEYQQEELWSGLYKECNELAAKNEEILKSIENHANTTVSSGIDHQNLVSQLYPSLSTFSNVISLFNATHTALNNAQMDIESVCRYLPKVKDIDTLTKNVPSTESVQYTEDRYENNTLGHP